MIYGFTGTQVGMSEAQKYSFENICRLALTLGIFCEFHHGDCIGADADAHDIAEKYMEIIIHPPINPSKRAFKKAKKILEPKEYLDRNKDIVKVCKILIATPKEFEAQLRSGTWSTVRQAKRTNRLINIIYPDGTIK